MKKKLSTKSYLEDYLSKLHRDECDELSNNLFDIGLSLNEIIDKYEIEHLQCTKLYRTCDASNEHVCHNCGTKKEMPFNYETKNLLYKCEKCGMRMYRKVTPFILSFEGRTIHGKTYNYTKVPYFWEVRISYDFYLKLDIETKMFLGSILSAGIFDTPFAIQGAALTSCYKLAPRTEDISDFMTKMGLEQFSPFDLVIQLNSKIPNDSFMQIDNHSVSFDDQVELWMKIATREAAEVFYDSLSSKHLLITQKGAVLPILASLLCKYSLGQVVNIIWQAINDVCESYLNQEGNSAELVPDLIIFKCKDIGTYKLNDTESVECFPRPENLLLSNYAKYVYENVLNIGLKYAWEKAPTELSLKYLQPFTF